MCRVLGLDLSLTSTGAVLLKNGEVKESTTLSSSHKEQARLADLKFKIGMAIKFYKPELTVIEGYAFGRPNAMAGLAELGGVVKCSLFEMQQQILIVPPARVKKFATGRGNAKKDEVRLEVYKRWGFEAKTNDEVDAYVLARIGLAYLGYDDNLIKPQLEVIADLKKSA
jgi:crossover junction endodeoxyribonuclease RuvC